MTAKPTPTESIWDQPVDTVLVGLTAGAVQKLILEDRIEQLKAFPGRAPYALVDGPFTTVDGHTAKLRDQLNDLRIKLAQSEMGMK